MYNGEYFYPPRTNLKIPYRGPVLDIWKKYPDAIGQYKLNGTNTQIKVRPDRKIELWTRHRDENGPLRVKNYELPVGVADELLSLTPKGVYTVYNAELLHHKTKNIKHSLYFFDVLVWQGIHLVGMEYRERYKILEQTFGKRYFDLNTASYIGKFFLAENIHPSLWDLAWKMLQPSSSVEGLVLKRLGPISRLAAAFRVVNNEAFMVRIRKPNRNYQF